MISYEQYENKIKKFAKFRSFMNRFKFLFIAIFALMIAAVATLLTLKGSLSGEITISSSTYGESYDDPAGVSAFLSSVSYEYALEGSENWSSQKPVKAGKYSVRAVSNKTVGKGYSSTASFEIAPREVTFAIESDSVEYGSVPSKLSLPLLEGDKLDKDALLFVYDDYVAEKTGVDLNESSVKIMNGSDDRSACYIIRHEKKELVISKRSINVSLIEEEFTYSGVAISYSQTASPTTEKRLANGDIIRIDGIELKQNGVRVDRAIHAGNYEATIRGIHIYKVIGGKEIEVTSQYEPAFYSTAFTIAKKDVTVTTASAEKVYDGTSLEKADYDTTGFVAGDKFNIVKSNSISDVGVMENKITAFTLINQDGDDVRDNYKITFKFGTLSVSPRKITVSSPDLKEVYNGQPHSAAQAIFEDELFEAKATNGLAPSIKTVGKITNVVDFDIYKKTTGEIENKANFNIETAWGTLEITKRAITIKIENVQKLYDGTPLTATPENGTVALTADTSLGYGDSLVSGSQNDMFAITDVQISNGQVIGVENTSKYRIVCDGSDRTENYNITYERGTLTVTPRHISITTHSSKYVYDGNPHSDSGYTVYEGGSVAYVLDGSLKLISSPSFTNYAQTKGKTKNNECKFTVSDNYVIDSFDYGTITILQRPLTVTGDTVEFVYDGEAHTDKGYTALYNGGKGLVGTDELTVTPLYSFTNVAETRDAAGNNICDFEVPSDNYFIDMEMLTYGTVWITVRPIHVLTASAEKIYDGGALSKNEYVGTYYNDGWEKHEGLIGNDKLTLENGYEITEVAESGDNRCTFVVPNDNYFIVISAADYGKLTILPRPLRVTTASAEKTYDGGELSKNEYTGTYYLENGVPQKGLLFEGEVLTLKKAYSITNVKESGDNRCTFEVPNGNYEIVGYDYGTLTIKAKDVSIKLSDVEAVYGENYEIYPSGLGNFANRETCGLVGDDTLEISVRFELDPATFVNGYPAVKWTENGEIDSYQKVVVFRTALFSGSDEENYDISYESGSLKILQRVLHIYMKSAKTFYGEDLQKVDGTDTVYHVGDVYPAGEGNVAAVYYIVGSGPNAQYLRGLLEGDTLEVTKVRYYNEEGTGGSDEDFVAPKNAGSYSIKPYEILIHTADGRTVTTTDEDGGEERDNYLVRYFVQGTLKIMLRPIVLTLNEIESTMYDGQAREYTSGGETVVRGDTEEQYRALLKNPEGLVYGEKLNVRVTFKSEAQPVFYGKYTYSFDIINSFIEEPDGTGGYQTSAEGIKNYGIICKDGSFEIKKRPVTVKMNDLELVYGYKVEYPTADIYTVVSEIDFVEDERICWWTKLDFGYERVHPSVGTYRITGTPQAVNYHKSAEINVIDSYDITVEAGELTITPLEKTVYLAKKDATYGQVVNESTLMWAISGPTFAWDSVEAHFFQNGKEVTPKNVGFYDILLIPRFYLWELGEYDDLNNYIFSYEWRYDYIGEPIGEDGIFKNALEIRPLVISVKVESRTITYGNDIGEIAVICSPELPYGEKLTAVLYSEKDGERITPKYAGTYDVFISELFIDGGKEGLSNYDFDRAGELQGGTLTIEPRPISVKLDDLTVKYGEEVRYPNEDGEQWKHYTIVAGNLVYGDTLSVYYDFDLSGTSEVRPDFGTYEIVASNKSVLSGDGNAYEGEFFVADSYIISIENATLTVQQRIVSLYLKNMRDFYYDGEAHYYPGGYFALGEDGMAEGEKLIVAVKYFFSNIEMDYGDIVNNGTEVSEIAKAGWYACAFDYDGSTVEDGGLKGIYNYNIFVASNPVTCTVWKRVISVEFLELGAQVYGTPVLYPEEAGNYQAVTALLPQGENALAEGEELTLYVIFFLRNDIEFVYNNNSVLPAGEYGFSMIGAVVTGGEFADVKNYEIECSVKYFTVEKRHVTITLSDVETDYGEAPVYPYFEGNYQKVETLPDGETLTVMDVRFELPERATVGEYESAVWLTAIRVLSKDGVDVTENYTFEGIESKVTVNRRAILVATNMHKFVYDGEAHSDGGYTIYYQDSAEHGLAYDDESALHEDYVGEGKLPTVQDYTGDFIANVFAIVIKNGLEDVMANYEISYEYNYIWVEQLTIYVKTKSYSKVYDGLPLEVPNDDLDSCYYYPDNDPMNEKIEGLVKDHRFTFTSMDNIIDVGEWLNRTIDDIVDGNGVSQYKNYKLASYQFGRLKVEAREIYVEASSAEKVYDGTPLYSPSEEYVVYSYPNNDHSQEPLFGADKVLVSGHSFEIVTPYVLNAGDPVPNNPYAGVREGSVNKSGNYKIILLCGSLTVTKRPVNYQISDVTMDYCNAGPDKTPEYTVQREGEVENCGILDTEWDSFTFTITYRSKTSGSLATRFDADVYTINLIFNSTAAGNYSFMPIRVGTLTIDRVNLVISPKEIMETYISPDQVVTITPSDIQFEGDTMLATGDRIVSLLLSRNSLKATENKMCVSVKIVKDSVKIQDMNTHVDATKNYNIKLNSNIIGFKLRKVYFEQKLPSYMDRGPTGRGILPYTGEGYTVADNGSLYNILSADDIASGNFTGVTSFDATSYGLLSCDKAVLKSANVGKEVGIYRQWVILNVVNGTTGAKMSNLYDVVLVMRGGEDTSIEVLPQEVSVTLKRELDEDLLRDAETGITMLNSDEYLGPVIGLLAGHELEIGIYKDEEGNISLYVFIFTARYKNGVVSSRSDKSTIYHVNVTFASGIQPNVKLVDVWYYPST